MALTQPLYFESQRYRIIYNSINFCLYPRLNWVLYGPEADDKQMCQRASFS